MSNKRLNTRFLLIFSVSVLAFLTCTYFVHGFQVRRNADVLISRAESARSAGDLALSADYYRRYLGFVPNDAAALGKYGLLLSDPQFAKNKRDSYAALQILEKALRSNPNQHDLRRSAVRLSIELNLFANARDDLNNYLLPVAPEDGELHKLLAQSLEGSGAYSDARDEYRQAIRLAPTDVDTYCRLARLLRRHAKDVVRDKERPADVIIKADDVMKSMISANDKSYRAWLSRAEYLLEFAADDKSTPELIARDIAKALEVDPNAADVIIAGAELARRQGKPDEARSMLQRGCQLHPADWRIYMAQARLEGNQGKTEAAIAILREGLTKATNQPDLLWNLADALTTAGKRDDVAEVLGRLESIGVRPSDLEIFRARLLMNDEQWWEAAKLLERVAPSLAARGVSGSASFLEQQAILASLLLGRCCEQLGDLHRAKSAYGRALAHDSRSITARMGLARTLAALGQRSEALDQYRQIIRIPGAPAQAWIEITRLCLVRNLERDESSRDWAEVENAIRIGEQIVPLPVAIVVFHAEMLTARKQLDDARRVVEKQYPDPAQRPAEAWTILANLEQRKGRPEAADAILQQAKTHLPKSIDLRLAEARLLAARGGPQALVGLTKLSEDWRQIEMADRVRLLDGLAGTAMQMGDTGLAKQFWTQLAQDRPNDLNSYIGLFDIAAATNDVPAMTNTVTRLRQIEGDEGVMWRFARASMLLAQAVRGDKAGLPEARALLGAVAVRRPDWSRLAISQAQLEDLEGGRSDAALASYQKAVQSGDRDIFAMRRTIELLYERKRYSEAYELMKRLPNQASMSQSLKRIGAELSLYSKDNTSAFRLAESAVAKDSGDYRDHLWLGRFHLASGQTEAAAKSFERARELAATEPSAWVALIQFHASTGNRDRARSELEIAKSKLPPGSPTALALACSYEAIGAMDQARAQYEAATAAAPNDVTATWSLANFLFRTGQFADCEPILRRLQEMKSQSPAVANWARRNLAVIMTIRGDAGQKSEALTLLATTPGSGNDSVDAVGDQRTRATILTLQSGVQSRREASKILEGLIDRRVAIAEDYFLVAQLHEALGDWLRARHRYLGFMEFPGADTPANLFIVARSLLRHGDVESARPMVKQFVANPAVNGTFPSIEIQARLLHADKKNNDALALIQTYTRSEGARLPSAAALLSELGAHGAAEEIYRLNAERSGKPADSVVLAKFLLDRQRFGESMELCERIWSEAPPLAVAEVALGCLAKTLDDPRMFERVERRINESIKKSPDSAGLVAALAAVRNFQERFDEAEQLYRRALAIDSRLDVALNNLAWLLSLRGSGAAEALGLLRRAAEVGGMDPGLLDTRGVAYLALKQGNSIDLAIDDFRQASEEAPSPSTYFHLAQAYSAVGRRKDAGQAWRNAKSLGLNAGMLHPLERPAFERLSKELN